MSVVRSPLDFSVGLLVIGNDSWFKDLFPLTSTLSYMV